jgi:hypothetical protein
VSFYFATIGVGSSICASEIDNYYNEDDENKEHVVALLTIANVSTFLLSTITVNLIAIVASILGDYLIHLKWQRTKNTYNHLDNLFSTGLWQYVVFEVLLSLVMNYPSLYGHTYTETAND